MNRSSTTLAAVALLLGGATSARAQPPTEGQAQGYLKGPQGDIGVKLSESSILHVGVTAEGGYDTNVFYSDANRVQSALVRVIPSVQLTNAGREGEIRADTVYDLGVSLLYREYLSNDSAVRAQRAFNPTAHASLGLGGPRAFKLSLGDQFTRTEDAPYVGPADQATGAGGTSVGRPIIRDNNLGVINAAIAPGGGRLTLTLRYTNALDYYETVGYKHSTNMTHEGMLDASWKWLPKTAVYLQGAVGFVHYLNPNADTTVNSAPGAPPPATTSDRHDSMPIHGQLGLRGFVTPKTTVSFGAGYATALYQGGTCDVKATACNPTGLSNVMLNFDVAYVPTLLTRLGLSLQHGFRNSPVIGNFYDVDAANLTVSQMLGSLVFGAIGRYEYRRYQGYQLVSTGMNLPRRDHVVVGGATIDYFVQKWFYAGVAYSIILDRANESELGPVAGTGLSYTKQQVFARIGVTY